ncbi:3-isopropylmalate dehydrogenase [Acidocella aquatica]|uniref:3-isopropylmalate dehydrogenase n=1 Tax=Acidocella aquatica TaxID=1922313 RepID=A0ABQ6A2S3_9PROT|nr:3-isopropylmalate dehydrogenase [Acidocella aquatica]GLR65927.1 3-isopropylmalate dehydrogenase [Acidocella aquatica]
MSERKNLLLMPGDGIGPEVMAQAKRVLDWLQKTGRADFAITEELVGGASIDAHGVPLTEAALAHALAADAVLFGSVGGPKWDTVPFDIRPEAALLKLRKEMGVFANLRPAKVFDALVDASSLKPELVRGLDIMIVRELIGGIYFGEPRGIETLPDGSKRGVNTEVYTTGEIERVGRVAFELARKRQNRVCSVEKANVMESGLLWRQVMTALHAAEYPDVQLSHMYADNCAMQLAKNPRQFDVIVTGNLFGDILSDLAAMLTGSLGLLPSATLGAVEPSGRRAGFYEPIHGSAPDIAGKGLANPLAQILSLALMLRYSFGQGANAALIEQAVENVLAKAGRTPDIAMPGRAKISTSEMGDALLAELEAL